MYRRCPIARLFLALCLAACGGETDSEQEELAGTESAVTAATCAPNRGATAVNEFQKALHDSIAFAEGTKGRGKDGYDIGFAYKKFSSCAVHPNVKTCSGSLCSTASGRYQFLKKTWDPTATAIKAKTFEPENQEKGAEYLVKKVRKVTVPADRALSATEFSNAMKKLSYEWASLPPGRYGQPNRTEAALRQDYCANVGEC
jgi:muramidase (phage lysozyme)